MDVTHLGHACLLVDTGRARLLIDPGTLSDVGTPDGLDAVLITHQHPDHLDLDALERVLAANPAAALVVDADTASAVAGLPEHSVARPGERLTFGGAVVDVLGGIHAPVYGDVPGCTNSAYLVDDGALLHPGDSFFVPEQDVDVLAVAIDGPWLKLAEAIDYLTTVRPRLALPVYEGETTDPAKYAGMLDGLSGGGIVRPLDRGQPTSL
ncbi:MBL fold metallo-hydrolase [uncultured Jatrophihabitans sp.]|uniref:MBL fold metallo-hydrolase n=1 Tax=uncultured Jatrophihabitans sp. TaxID=1610747 RepID=UPI0035CAB254